MDKPYFIEAPRSSFVVVGNVLERRVCDGCGKLLIRPHPIVYSPETGKIYCGGECLALKQKSQSQ